MLLLETIAVGAEVPVGIRFVLQGGEISVSISALKMLLSAEHFAGSVSEIGVPDGIDLQNSMLPCNLNNPFDTSAAWMLLEGQSSLGAAELLAVLPPWQSVCLSVRASLQFQAGAAALHATRESILQ